MNLELLILLAVTLAASGQYDYDYYYEKPGSCPPPIPVQLCSRSCFYDSHCQGVGKCCPTNCGGSICSRPVTMRNNKPYEKPGTCPAKPTGRWVCSPTCTVDNDCKGTKKCCKNRCGALACQTPDVEVLESVEVPVQPNPEEDYIPNDNSNSYPYYFYNNA